jgi:hypothetical protein
VSNPMFPYVNVKLSGTDGNVFAIINNVQRALRDAGASEGQLRMFYAEATSGDYDDAIQTCMKWVRVS